MTLNQRERKIVIAVAIVLGLFLGDRYIIEPYIDTKHDLDRQIAEATDQEAKDNALMKNSDFAKQRWKEMTAWGLKTDQNAADSQMLNSISEWARDAGLPAPAVKPDRMEQEKQFRKIVYHISTGGPLRSITRFLWRIQTANIPARVTDLQLAARKEGIDDLQMTVGISTLFVGPEPTQNGTIVKPKEGE